MARPSDEVLRASDLHAGYGRVKVIRNATVTVSRGEVVGLVGRNGAGKTTFISAIAGLIAADEGTIAVGDVDVTTLPANRRVAAGLALVPSGGRLFKSLTVQENLEIGTRHARMDRLELVFGVFPELLALRRRYAGKLSGGERQMVAIGRALMMGPRLLLMDEPSEGLAPIVVLRLVDALKSLRGAGLGILVAEQNVKFTDIVCQRWYAIDKGVVTPIASAAALAEGTDRTVGAEP